MSNMDKALAHIRAKGLDLSFIQFFKEFAITKEPVKRKVLVDKSPLPNISKTNNTTSSIGQTTNECSHLERSIKSPTNECSHLERSIKSPYETGRTSTILNSDLSRDSKRRLSFADEDNNEDNVEDNEVPVNVEVDHHRLSFAEDNEVNMEVDHHSLNPRTNSGPTTINQTRDSYSTLTVSRLNPKISPAVNKRDVLPQQNKKNIKVDIGVNTSHHKKKKKRRKLSMPKPNSAKRKKTESRSDSKKTPLKQSNKTVSSPIHHDAAASSSHQPTTATATNNLLKEKLQKSTTAIKGLVDYPSTYEEDDNDVLDDDVNVENKDDANVENHEDVDAVNDDADDDDDDEQRLLPEDVNDFFANEGLSTDELPDCPMYKYIEKSSDEMRMDKLFHEANSVPYTRLSDCDGIDIRAIGSECNGGSVIMRFNPDAVKPFKQNDLYHLYFIVLSGIFEVELLDQLVYMHAGSQFRIPVGNPYSLKNVSTVCARVVYTYIKC